MGCEGDALGGNFLEEVFPKPLSRTFKNKKKKDVAVSAVISFLLLNYRFFSQNRRAPFTPAAKMSASTKGSLREGAVA